MASVENTHEKKKYRKRNHGKVCFDKEVVPKHAAQEILAKEKASDVNGAKEEKEAIKTKEKKRKQKDSVNDSKNDFAFAFSTENNEPLESDQSEKGLIDNGTVAKKTKKKKKKQKDDESVEGSVVKNDDEVSDHAKSKKKREKQNVEETKDEEATESAEKRKKKKKKHIAEESVEENVNEESNAGNSGTKKEESIRARKRKKYAQLLAEKKSKTELALQQKSLNYLSKWKHSRNDWKFEKLTQIWLQRNMYDSSKIPSEFWETLVEYFSNSKGKAREVLLKAALKIIEEEEGLGGDEGGEKSVKAERARDIIQNLQE